MAWPATTTISTTNLDSAADDPSLARADLLLAVQTINQMAASGNAADGVVLLNASGLLPQDIYPTLMETQVGEMGLYPFDEIVRVNNRLVLNPLTVDQIGTIDTPETGTIIYCSNGDAGSPCLTWFNGTDWKVITATATISAT